MIEELLRIYDESRLNRGQPESIFNPTLIFNEGWLLRAGSANGNWCRASSVCLFCPSPPRRKSTPKARCTAHLPRDNAG